jgi:hypothetical protein
MPGRAVPADAPARRADQTPATRAPLERVRRGRRVAPVALALAGLAAVVLAVIAIVPGRHSHHAAAHATKAPAKLAGLPDIAIGRVPAGPVPRPTETIQDAADRLTAAYRDVQAKRCREVQVFNRISFDHLPCDPRPGHGFQHIAGFTVTVARAFRTGGVIEYVVADKPGRIGVYGLVLDSGGRLVPIGAFWVSRHHALGAQPTNWPRHDKLAAAFVKSLRTDDCDLFYGVTLTPQFSRAQKPEACAKLMNGIYSDAARQLRLGRPLTLFRLGGTNDFAFYGVRIGNRYWTLVTDAELARGLFPEGKGLPARG